MAGEKITIVIVPTADSLKISENDLTRLSRMTKLPPEALKQRISDGKAINLITREHPKLKQVADLIKSLGFSVTISPWEPVRGATGVRGAGTVSTPGGREIESEWVVGDVIENLYEVLDIRHGGMGAVYLVRHRRLNTMMAVKSLLQRLRQNEEDRTLFVREAETWIDIGFHPNIAACYYVRNIDNSPRIFIEYVDSGSLMSWVQHNQPMGWDLMIDLMVQACDGLGHAHSKGLVHRDVKPGNCLMTKDGTLKVTDFGLTKRAGLEGGDSVIPFSISETAGTRSDSITAAGMGTPGYMAPEMWIPKSHVGPQADIYAFGVMFFEICCGRKPFVPRPGEKRVHLAFAHVKKPPPSPTSLRPDMPKQIEQLILRCLEKDPAARYWSFQEIREELARIYNQLYGKRFSREQPDEVRLLADALNNRAVSLMDLNHAEEAELTLLKALESDPHHPEAVYNKGIIEWDRTRNPDWELVRRLEEVVKTPEYRGRGAHLLGRCLLRLGDADRALKACELALSSDESAEEWLKSYAIALVGSGRDEDAIETLEKYLSEYPVDDEAQGWLVGALIRQGRMEQASSHMKSFSKGSDFAGWDPEQIAKSFVLSDLSEQMILKGHGGWVTSICHFPRSNLIMTGARDRTIRIWDGSSGELKRTIPLVGEPPAWLLVSPNEGVVALAAAQSGAPVRILDLEAGKFKGNPLVHEGTITSATFSADAAKIITVEQKGTVRLWQAPDFKTTVTHKIPAHTAAAIVFDGSGEPEIVIAGLDRVVKKVRLVDAKVMSFQGAHREAVTHLKASPDGSRVLTCSRDREIMAWDGTSGRTTATFQVHQENVSILAVNPVRSVAASYDAKAGIKLWDTQNGMVLRTFLVAESEMICLAFTRDGQRLIAGGRDMAARTWDVRGRPIIPAMALSTIRPVTKQMKSERKFKAMVEVAQKSIRKKAYSSAFSILRDCQRLPGYERSELILEMIVRMKDHGTRTGLHGGWNRKTFETQSSVMDVSFSPSAIYFLTAHADHAVRMWSTKTGNCLKVLKGHTNLVAAVKFSANGREAVSGGDDRTVRVWDLQTGKNSMAFKGHLDSVSAVTYSRNGGEVLSGSWDSTIKLWRLADGACVKTFQGHDDKVSSVSFVGGHDHIVSAGFGGSVKMWDLTTGRVLRDLRGHRDRVTSLSVSPDNDLLLTCSMDGTARLWDLRTGQCKFTVDVNEAGVRTGAFSPHQGFFLTGGNDAVLRIWDVERGQCQREFQGHAREITAAEFSSNGRFVISAGMDGFVLIWELDWDWKFNDPPKDGQYD
jgi:WD40 repeat protein/serine/threonine protein kinase